MTLRGLVIAGVLLFAASSAAAKHKVRAKKPPPPPPPPPTGFPSSCEVDQFLEDTLAMASKDRLPAALAMIKRMQEGRAPRDRDPLGLWDYFLQRWAVRFFARGEMDVLEAVDQSRAAGAFVQHECSFYRTILKDRRAVGHYRYQANRGRLAICFEPDEVERLLALPAEGARDAPFSLTRVTACEADELVAGLAQGGTRARRVELLIKEATAENGDPAGTSYLLARLATRYGARPDEAILAGFDAAMRDTPLEKRPCALYWSPLKGKAGCAVYRQHYQDVASIPERCVTEDIKRCLEK